MGLLSIISHRVLRAGLCVVFLLTWNAVAASQVMSASRPLALPTNIALDSSGNLYVSETERHTVLRIDPSGAMTTFAGSGVQGFGGDGATATAALLDSPRGLLVSGGKLYIADSHNHRVRSIDLSSGVITTAVGDGAVGSGGDGGKGTDATLDLPVALAAGNQGELYIADVRAHRIRKLDAEGNIATVAGSGIQGFDGDDGGASSGLFDSPSGLAVDASGNILIADSHNHRIRRIEVSSGKIFTLVGTGAMGFGGDQGAAKSATLALPRGLGIDEQGNLYIADTANHRIRRVDGTTGTITTIAGNGIQAFAGDGGSPTNASLNAPQGISWNSSGAIIADVGNDRVRSISGSTIESIAGQGAKARSVVVIGGADRTTYGSGELVIRMSSTDATGSVHLIDIPAGAPSLNLGDFALTSQSARVDLSSLPAGKHAFLAAYSGDSSHSATSSGTFNLTVTPRSVSATVSPSSIVYGTSLASLSGALQGVLDRDASKITGKFTSNVGRATDVGSYPVDVSLEGEAAANYTLTTQPSMTVTQAPTTTSVSVTAATLVNGNTVGLGEAVLISAHVASTTSGVPGGTVTVLDAGRVVGTAQLGLSGDASITTTSLTEGTHSLSASFSGAKNFRSSSSSSKAIIVGTPGPAAGSDFAMVSTGAATANIVAGNSAVFTFAVTPESGLSSKVALSASGAPDLAAVSFDPAIVPPGAPVTVTMTISTQKAEVRQHAPVVLALLMPPVVFLFNRRAAWTRLVAVLIAGILMATLSGCGDRVFTGNSSGASSKTYSITVTGTATGTTGATIQHALNFSMTVIPNR